MAVQELNVYYLPNEIAAEELVDSTVVVIDLLRATTTICFALAAGATEVVPFREIEEAREAARKVGRENVILGGERGGARIEGFDLGNSPTEYRPKTVEGKSVYITTTNGTQALYHARLARRIIVGAIVNLSAVVDSVKNEGRVDILCAGTDGHVTGEDILAAGAIVRGLQECLKGRAKLNESAVRAASGWMFLQKGAEITGRKLSDVLANNLRGSRGGRNCIEVGNGNDLPDCADIDRFSIVPQLDVANWRITAK